MDPSGLEAYGRVCGWTLARAHARSGDRIAIAAYLGRGDAFDRAMASFAETYADQNDRDYRDCRRQRPPAGHGRDDRLTYARPHVEARRMRTVETCCAASSITSRSGRSSLQSLPGIVGLVLLLVWLIRRLVPAVREGFDAEVSSQILGSVAALFGLLLAFIVVIAYQSYGDTQNNVNDEAGALAAIVRDSGAFPQSDGDRVRGSVGCVCTRRRRR